MELCNKTESVYWSSHFVITDYYGGSHPPPSLLHSTTPQPSLIPSHSLSYQNTPLSVIPDWSLCSPSIFPNLFNLS